MAVAKKWLVMLTGVAAMMVAVSPEASAGVTPTTPAPFDPGSAKAAIAGKYIVVLKSDSSAKGDLHADSATAVKRARGYGAKVEREFSHALRGYAATMNATQLAKVRRDPDVAYVEADQVYSAGPDLSIKVAADYPYAWNLDRVDQRSNNLDGQYNYTADGTSVTAYIIDTGIRATHQDFGGRVSGGFTAVGDGNGTSDCEGHGTHVAGTVGSAHYGVAKNVSLVPVRVLDCDGHGSTSGVVAGVDWVTANHAARSVANMSLGGGLSPTLNSAVSRSINSGVTYSVAAGNENQDACNVSPASTPDALTVGWTNESNARSVWSATVGSNYGHCLDLFAPGEDVWSTYGTGDTDYAQLSGTSMATPHVTGAAALYLQKHPNAAPAEVRAAIVGSATPRVLTNTTGGPNLMLYTLDLKLPRDLGASGQTGVHKVPH